MSDKKSSETMDRLHDTVVLVREDLLREAFRVVFARHALTTETKDFLPIVLTDQQIKNSFTGRLYCGTCGQQDVTLYTPGIIERTALGGCYPLVVLNVLIHERTHNLSDRALTLKHTSEVDGMLMKCHALHSGFSVQLIFELGGFERGGTVASSYRFFNEGVTESLAREVMHAYLRLHPDFAGVDPALVRKHMQGVHRAEAWSFYPAAVYFVQQFTRFLSTESGDLAREWAGLYESYMNGTNLLTNLYWRKRFAGLNIQQLMDRVAKCNYFTIPILGLEFAGRIAKATGARLPDREVWEELQLVPARKTT